MTGAAVIVLALALAGVVGCLVWLAKTALSDRARTADTLFDLATAQGEIERAQFELEATTKALSAEKARTAALERSLTRAIDINPGAGLADDDVTGRMLRIYRDWAVEARGADGEVPAEPAGPVLVPSATDAPGPGAVPGAPDRVP